MKFNRGTIRTTMQGQFTLAPHGKVLGRATGTGRIVSAAGAYRGVSGRFSFNEVLLDYGGRAHERFGLRVGEIVVVRPDKYLASVSRGLDPAPAQATLALTLARARVGVL